MPLPKDNALRKALPLFTFLTEYFPDAILELVKVSVAGNMKHNPGEPMHWARGKSMDQLNTAQRHMFDYGMGEMYNDHELAPEILAAIGGEPPMHLANAAWRLLAQIQLDCEERASSQEEIPLCPDAYQLTPDPLQPEERVVGMHPALVHRATVPGRLKLDCGCFGSCKGLHEFLEPTRGTGPRDPRGNLYMAEALAAVQLPPFDPAD